MQHFLGIIEHELAKLYLFNVHTLIKSMYLVNMRVIVAKFTNQFS